MKKYAAIAVKQLQEQILLLHACLKSHLHRLTANRQDADDLAHDAYIEALNNLSSFAGKSTLKTRLFAIATNKEHIPTKRYVVLRAANGRCRAKPSFVWIDVMEVKLE